MTDQIQRTQEGDRETSKVEMQKDLNDLIRACKHKKLNISHSESITKLRIQNFNQIQTVQILNHWVTDPAS